MARLKERYNSEIAPDLVKQFNYKNVMQAPKLEKIVINMGVGRAGQTGGDAKELDGAVRDMTAIAGQKPVITRARKSIANFKLREGSRVGCKVTLRGERMYEFYDRLVNSDAAPYPRLSGHLAQLVRRTRQLRDGHERAAHFPGNRVR